jgi:hypothetical protein
MFLARSLGMVGGGPSSDNRGRGDAGRDERTKLDHRPAGRCRPGADRNIRRPVGTRSAPGDREQLGERERRQRCGRGPQSCTRPVHQLSHGTLGQAHRLRDLGAAASGDRDLDDRVALPARQEGELREQVPRL